MKFKKILFPTDFSTRSDEALQVASNLANQTGARLLIMHAQEPPVLYGEGSYYYGVPEPDADALRKMLDDLKPEDSSIAVERHFVRGEPAEAIVELAKQEGVDLIVMSSHGRTGLSRLLMGSVAERVMRHAEAPILVVKPRVKAEREETVGSMP